MNNDLFSEQQNLVFLYQKDNKILVHVEIVLISYIYGFECISKGETIS